MLRLISVLLVLLGLGAVVWGGMRYLNMDRMSDRGMNSVTGVPPETAKVLPPANSKSERMAGAIEFEDDDISVGIASTGAPSEIMTHLRTVPIAHETPSSAKFGRPFDVTVAIDATGDDTAADALPGRGNIVEDTAQVSGTVMAALSGDQFAIEAVTPMTQTVSPLTENVWRWRVTPTQTGAHDLVVELFALEGNTALPVRTFRDKVEVQVSPVGQVIAAVDSVSPLAIVIGGIGSFLGGLFGVARFFRVG